MRRQQLRMGIFAVVVVVIGIALLVEPPGVVGGLGYAVVLVAIIASILRERRRPRG
jgi:hypothetical protein